MHTTSGSPDPLLIHDHRKQSMTAEAAGSPTRTTTFPFEQVVVIFNPHSTGSAPELAEQLRTDLERRLPRTPVHLSPTEHAGHARDLARNAAPTPRTLIVSVSGDGGYNEVVDGVMQAGDTGTVFHRGEKPVTVFGAQESTGAAVRFGTAARPPRRSRRREHRRRPPPVAHSWARAR
jgi:hypothetical protein